MKGKGVLVTGAGTGLGREIALEFARQGANVVFHFGQNAAGAQTGVAEARSGGTRAEAFKADFGMLSEVERLGNNAELFLGRVDILVNNAGITYNKPFLQVDAGHFEKIYNVNVRAGFFLAQRLVPAMVKAKWGAICNITSIHGLQGAAEHSVYAGTKGAIIAQTRALAMELAHKGVRVNAIASGCVPVDNYSTANPGYSEAAAKKWAANAIPVGRYGYPVEIARLAVFLCSDAASFIVGQTVTIDGGTTALMSLATDFRGESAARFGERYL